MIEYKLRRIVRIGESNMVSIPAKYNRILKWKKKDSVKVALIDNRCIMFWRVSDKKIDHVDIDRIEYEENKNNHIPYENTLLFWINGCKMPLKEVNASLLSYNGGEKND